MKKLINGSMILSIFLLLEVGAKGSTKSQARPAGMHGGKGISVMAKTVSATLPGMSQSTVQQGATVVQPGTVMTVIQQPIVNQPQLTQGAMIKLFDEEKHLREKLKREKAYSALQYVALECFNILESLEKAQNKVVLGQLALANSNNPNTVLGKTIAVKYGEISNAGGFGYYLSANPNQVLMTPLQQQPAIGMFMTQERSQEILTVQEFVKKWSDVNTYLNIRPDDQAAFLNIQSSYRYLSNLVKKYLGKDLVSLVLNSPDRINNEVSALLNILNNQLLPVLLNNPNYKTPYENLKNKINPLGANARYVFGILCECIYTDGRSINSNTAKNWAQNGIK